MHMNLRYNLRINLLQINGRRTIVSSAILKIPFKTRCSIAFPSESYFMKLNCRIIENFPWTKILYNRIELFDKYGIMRKNRAKTASVYILCLCINFAMSTWKGTTFQFIISTAALKVNYLKIRLKMQNFWKIKYSKNNPEIF